MIFRRIVKSVKFKHQCSRKQHEEQSPEKKETPVFASLDLCIAHIRMALGDSADVKLYTFSFGHDSALQGALLFIDGLVDSSLITQSILGPILAHRFTDSGIPDTIEELRRSVLCSGDVTEEDTMEKLMAGSLNGDTALFVDGMTKGLVIDTKGWEKRSISEPQSESVVRGPREGFTENFRTNTALIRRRIKAHNLRLDHMVIGRQTKTQVCVAYIDDIANTKVVDTVKKRLEALSIDSILDTGYIEQYIEDAPFSIFPTIGYSEKPDVVAARMLEGRVAIIADGSPFVLTAPHLFIESFQTAEDYYVRTVYSNIIRIMRFLAFFVTVFGPAIFIALTTFHQELIPTTLLYTIADAREGTPFPAFFEALILIFAFEILREAGIRLPRPVGQAISIVGALVMGEAAVSAGLVGAPIVITIAITAVSGFVVPSQADSAAIMRLISMIFAALLGGYGIAMVFLAMLLHLAKLESFGTPYYETVRITRDLQDSYIRVPLWKMSKRPRYISEGNITRRNGIKPPPDSGEATT